MGALPDRSTDLHPYRGFYASGHGGDDARQILGKPLRWTRGWSAVLAILLVSAALLLAVRLEMGPLSAWSARESTAVRRVKEYKPTGTESLNDLIVANAGVRAGRWYAFDRPWEHRVYVVWQWRDVVLSFTVHGARVTPDESTRAILGVRRDAGQPANAGVPQP